MIVNSGVTLMKILIANRNYFITGGPEKYLFSLMKHMADYDFIPFCVNFDKNLETPYSNYFVESPGGSNNIYFKDFEMPIMKRIAYALDMVYSFKSRRKLETLILETRPDVSFFLNVVFFTDSIVDACRKYNVPIIWRLSDFHKICASYLLYRDGHICEDCLEKNLFEAVWNRCGGYQRSRIAALIRIAGMYISRFRSIYDYVNYFVVPSKFSREKIIQGGFPPDKLIHIPTFVDTKSVVSKPNPNTLSILYVGRISHEKGMDILIEAFSLMKDRKAILSIAGDNRSDYAQALITSVPDNLKSRINFLGFQNQQQVSKLFDDNSFFVVPSVWYDNQPNALLEGMSHGRPAIVSRIGSLTEMVADGETGYHFEPGNSLDLANKMDTMLENTREANKMGVQAREYVRYHHSIEQHLSALKKLFEKCIG
jgi:glycosyltransferase involved in cell wall biosynthesis